MSIVIAHKTLEYIDEICKKIISGEINEISIIYFDTENTIKQLCDAIKNGKVIHLYIMHYNIDEELLTDLIVNCHYLESLYIGDISFYEQNLVRKIFKSLGTKKYLEIFSCHETLFENVFNKSCLIDLDTSIMESNTLYIINTGMSIDLDLHILNKLEENKKYVLSLRQLKEEINLFNLYLSKCKIKINYEVREEFILFTEKIEIKN